MHFLFTFTVEYIYIKMYVIVKKTSWMMGPRLNLSTEQTSPTLDILLALIWGSGSRAPTKKADKRRSLYLGARSPTM